MTENDIKISVLHVVATRTCHNIYNHSPVACITTVTVVWLCHKPFSQCVFSFHLKVASPLLKGLRQRHVASVIQVQNCTLRITFIIVMFTLSYIHEIYAKSCKSILHLPSIFLLRPSSKLAAIWYYRKSMRITSYHYDVITLEAMCYYHNTISINDKQWNSSHHSRNTPILNVYSNDMKLSFCHSGLISPAKAPNHKYTALNKYSFCWTSFMQKHYIHVE